MSGANTTELVVSNDLLGLLVDAEVHALKLRILAELERDPEPTSPVFMASMWGKKVNAVSYHARCLEAKGLVRVHRTRPVRGSTEHFYVLSAKAREAADAAPKGGSE